jgi:hypothetical protein
MTETNNLNISPRNYSYTEKTVRFKSFTDQSWGWGVGTYSEETIHWSREWNETWYLCSYQCWYFDVDRKWATVEVMIYIETLWENMFICFRPTEQTLTVFGRNFHHEVWRSSHMNSDILMVTIWRFLFSTTS